MEVWRLIQILEKCDPNDEITFIFDENERFSWDRGNGLKEASMVSVTGYKINGKIPLTNGWSSKLIEKDAPSIYTDEYKHLTGGK